MPPAAFPGLRPAAALALRRQGHPCPLPPCRASARRPHLRAAVLGRVSGARRVLGRILLKRREILRKRGRVRRSAVALRFVLRAGSEAEPVKLIIAIIQPNKLESVKEALSEVEVFRLTVLDVQGFGRQRGHAETYRGHEIAVNLLRKVQLQIAVNDEFVEPTIAAIVKGGRTGERGEIGDGKIFVLPMDECVRIRTGERGSEAI